MRKLPGFAIVCGMAAVCTAPVAAQQLPEAPPGSVPVCRNVTGTADIDGAPQQISGLACQQPDGTWQIQQGDDETLVYPVAAWPDYVDYGPWYGWWPPVFVGASFVFVDHFHHVYPMHQVYYGRPAMHAVSDAHGSFHHGAGMSWGAMGGGHRRQGSASSAGRGARGPPRTSSGPARVSSMMERSPLPRGNRRPFCFISRDPSCFSQRTHCTAG